MADSSNNLTEKQRQLIQEFYSDAPPFVSKNKKTRNGIWNDFKKNRDLEKFSDLKSSEPALFHEIEKAVKFNKNIQSAVFSECIYSRTLANHLGLNNFVNYKEDQSPLSRELVKKLKDLNIVPRYLYTDQDFSRILVQAGGSSGVDGAIVTAETETVDLIEFKEQTAKISEADLPLYDDQGFLVRSREFLNEHPQFESMLEEQISKRLNIFQNIGKNIHDFSEESIVKAVKKNYSGKKFAEVILTEDKNGILTMMPSSEVYLWAKCKGEIRTAGRNSKEVWTPERLKAVIIEKGGSFSENSITIPASKITSPKQRGGEKRTRVKIDQFFFAYSEKVKSKGSEIELNIKDVNQLKPTVSVHLIFKDLNADAVREHYMGLNNKWR